MRVYTIGGYGYDEAGFLEALQEAGVDTFLDTRQRRGVRGARYAFLNSARLQASLAEAGIRYVHAKDLAPTEAIRKAQLAADKQAGVGQRSRTQTTPAFKAAYAEEILKDFGRDDLAALAGPEAKGVALFCVETEPAACHRSVIADRLRAAGQAVRDLKPA